MQKELYTGPFIADQPQHLYIAPDERCQHIVAHYTILHPNQTIIPTKEYRILPDASGCIIFQGDRLDYWGPMQELVTLENDANEAKRRFFIEFHPGGLYAISGKELAPYKNERKPLSCFDQDIAAQLSNIYQTSNTYDDLVSSLNIWIYELSIKHPLPNRILDLKQHIDHLHGVITLDSLAQDCGLSPRQIRRDFARYIGLSPKEYANVVRINYIMTCLQKDDLVSTALEGGFFDQAHFNKVFKQILKVAPSSYFHNIEEFYREIYKF